LQLQSSRYLDSNLKYFNFKVVAKQHKKSKKFNLPTSNPTPQQSET
jgi:hypothetical protein